MIRFKYTVVYGPYSILRYDETITTLNAVPFDFDICKELLSKDPQSNKNGYTVDVYLW